MNEDTLVVPIRRVLLGLFLAALLLSAYKVLQPFFASLAWAVILCYVTWPIYRRLRSWLGNHPSIGAVLMTLLLGALFTLPIFWSITALRNELPDAYRGLLTYLERGSQALPEPLLSLPWIGPEIQQLSDDLAGDRDALVAQLVHWVEPWLANVLAILGDVGLNTFKFGFALLTAFFLYRDGERLLAQARQVLMRFLGERSRVYLLAIADTTRAVLYGLVLTALAQGLLASLGYWAAGTGAPALLGLITAVFALIPFGTPLVWGAAGIWLILTGELIAGSGLLLWGAVVVSQIDNLVRPLVISSTARIPFLLVLFGVLGGIGAFGLVGIFIGPIVIAILLAVWREWLEEQAAPVQVAPLQAAPLQAAPDSSQEKDL